MSMIVSSTGTVTVWTGRLFRGFRAATFGVRLFLAADFRAPRAIVRALERAFLGAARFAAFLRADGRFELFFGTRLFALAMAITLGMSRL